jgi:DNA-binding Lrp family transcriptional regulator
MNLISQAELARRLGITRQAVRDAHIKGRIRKVNGKIDLDCELTQDYIERSKIRQEKSSSKPKSHKVSGGRVVEETMKAFDGDTDPDEMEVDDVGADVGAIVSLERMTRRQAERQKLIEQILAMQVKTAKERKDLVSRDGAAKVFAKLAAVDTSELHPLGDSISAEVAAALGSDNSEAIIKVKKIIDKRVFRALKHRKRIMEDFLKKIGN